DAVCSLRAAGPASARRGTSCRPQKARHSRRVEPPVAAPKEEVRVRPTSDIVCHRQRQQRPLTSFVRYAELGACWRLCRIWVNTSAVNAINSTATPSRATLARGGRGCITTTRLTTTLRIAPKENISREHWPVRMTTVAGHQLRMELFDLI